MKITKVHILALTIIALFLLCLNACNQKTDVSQFITKDGYYKALKDCENSEDKYCVWHTFEPKVDKYCSDSKLPVPQCEQIKSEVIQTISKFAQEDTEKLKRAMEELRKGKK